MYSEAKLAFFIYLWYPKTKVWPHWEIKVAVYYSIKKIKRIAVVIYWHLIVIASLLQLLFQGTTYVYDSFFRPYVAKHETEIDRNLLELRTRAGDIAVLYWQKAASYGQTRIFEILQYVASQSTPRGRPAQVFFINSNQCLAVLSSYLYYPTFILHMITMLLSFPMKARSTSSLLYGILLSVIDLVVLWISHALLSKPSFYILFWSKLSRRCFIIIRIGESNAFWWTLLIEGEYFCWFLQSVIFGWNNGFEGVFLFFIIYITQIYVLWMKIQKFNNTTINSFDWVFCFLFFIFCFLHSDT